MDNLNIPERKVESEVIVILPNKEVQIQMTSFQNSNKYLRRNKHFSNHSQ